MGQKLLIVDDDEEILKLLDKKLLSEGFEIEIVSRGDEVTQKAVEFKPDLILMDIMLPDIDGPDAVLMLQENEKTANIPVLFISGIVASDSDMDSIVRVGERAYKAMAKPFTRDELLSEINKLIGTS